MNKRSMWLIEGLSSVSLKIVHEVKDELLGGSQSARSGKTMQVLLRMNKIDISELKPAYGE